MTAEQKDLARRFVACERWKWMPGMRAHEPYIDGWLRVAEQVRTGTAYLASVRRANEVWPSYPEHGRVNIYPDLTDPATLGCILALVRDATGDRRIHCRVRANVYRVYSGVSPVGRWMESEAEALLLALEAA
jgi:hypothetical protein